MSSTFQLLINGRAREGADSRNVALLNPADGQEIGRVASATTADLDDAVEAAKRGLEEWRAVSPWQRGAILKEAARIMRLDVDRLAATMTREQGKPIGEAREETLRSADFLEWGGEQARRIHDQVVPGRKPGERIEIQTHPIGVVAAFTPWNFPMALAAKKFAGALGAGCSIICKASEETPGSVLTLAQALLDAGVSPAAVEVLFGDPQQISAHLIAATGVAKITFTGSIPVGKLLAKAAGAAMKPVTMELGGHAPVIVCEDVDPEEAADIFAKAKFANAGQICLSPSRFFVADGIRDRFTARMVEHAKAWRVGDGMDPQTQMGPLANERRLAAVNALVNDARAHGAKILAGGQRIGNMGFFYAPTVLTDVPLDAAILHEEPFGPLAPILPFRDEDTVLAQANGLEVGLASYIVTRDASRARRLADRLEFGAVTVNGPLTHLPEAPLGGWKESGIGTEGGADILAPYQRTKHVVLR